MERIEAKTAGSRPLKVAAASTFKQRDRRMGWQQCAIATTLPVLAAGQTQWRQSHGAAPPRGYVWAILDGGADGLIACVCVHLKSNYGDVTDLDKMYTFIKRMVCAEQLVEDLPRLSAPDGRRAHRLIIAGDFNTDFNAPEFDTEKTLHRLFADGWRDAFEGVPEPERATHPGRGRYRSSRLDYILLKGWNPPEARRVFKSCGFSDHDAAFVRLPSAPARDKALLPVNTTEETFDDD